MNGKVIGGIVIVLIIILGAWYFMTSKSAGTPTTGTEGTPSGNTSINPQSQNMTVSYTDQGFVPQSGSIPVGATVTFVNTSGHALWVASDPHPAHSGYDGTSRSQHCAAGYTGSLPLDSCKQLAKGESYSFTFDKTGTWGYHNHSADNDRGSITVTPLVQNGGVTPGASLTASTSVSI